LKENFYFAGVKQKFLQGWTNVDWAIESHKSTFEYVFILGGGAISWQSRKQTMVVFSSIESESTTKEAMWLHQSFNDLGFHNQNLYHYIVIINHV
jgi:hypothetical protein